MYRQKQVAVILFLGIALSIPLGAFSQDGGGNFTIPLFKVGEEPKEETVPENQVANAGGFQIDLFGGKVIVPSLKGMTFA